ncbi:hypothetical protein [Nocardia tengchongensis]|uniref:hypothetical protein n=1 Tax=Nocardia tengchongensis TaxID=2055889 RepID=UPI0036B4739C
MAETRWEIRVLVQDTLQAERLTRELRATLDGLEQVDATLEVDSGDQAPLHKGGVSSHLLVVAGVAVPTAQAAARVLITAIREWSAVQRNRRVELRRGDHAVHLEGISEETVELLIDRLTDPGSQ